MTGLVAAGPLARSLRVALLALGFAVVAAALAEVALLADADIAPLRFAVLFPLAGCTYAGAGLVFWSRRPSNRTGPVLVAGGAAMLAAGLLNTAVRPLAAVGAVLAVVPLAVVVHLLLAFPSGRLRGRPARWTVAAGYAVALLAPLPASLFTPGSPIAVGDDARIAALSGVLSPLGTLVSLSAAVVLAVRLRTSSPARRRSSGPLLAYGLFCVLVVPLAARAELLGLDPLVRAVVQLVVVAVLPLAFVTVLLRGGFARASQVEELGSLLSSEPAQPLQDVLARVLGDPALQLLYWTPARQAWVDAAGLVVEDVPGPGRALVEVTTSAGLAGGLVYDVDRVPDPDLVVAAARPVGQALEAERLTAELRASERELQRSRARILATGDEERRRLARDLHDGLQVQLVLLALAAARLAADARDPGTAAGAERLRREVDDAAAELRRAVHALAPAALVERGLEAAVEDLVDRLPLPARLRMDALPGPLPEALESTVWYVLNEALTNALKHAGAHQLDVRLGVAEGHVFVEVADDGAGGATLSGGSGLRGLADRLDVVGGRLSLHSADGQGTRLRAELPWAA